MKVLLVEDNDADVYQIRRGLADESFSIDLRVAKDADEAVLMLTEKRPDLVILELNLPTVSGLLFLERNRPTVPVVVFTCSCHFHEIQRCFELGAKDFVHKPIDLEAYRRVVSYIVRTWGSHSVTEGSTC